MSDETPDFEYGVTYINSYYDYNSDMIIDNEDSYLHGVKNGNYRVSTGNQDISGFEHFTWSGWIYIDENQTDPSGYHIIFKDTSADWNLYSMIDRTSVSDCLEFGFTNKWGTYTYLQTNNFTYNEWFLLTCTIIYGALHTHILLHINGVEEGYTTVGEIPNFSHITDLEYFSDSSTESYYLYNSYIDDIRIFNDGTLDIDDMVWIYNNRGVAHGSEEFYYKCNFEYSTSYRSYCEITNSYLKFEGVDMGYTHQTDYTNFGIKNYPFVVHEDLNFSIQRVFAAYYFLSFTYNNETCQKYLGRVVDTQLNFSDTIVSFSFKVDYDIDFYNRDYQITLYTITHDRNMSYSHSIVRGYEHGYDFWFHNNTIRYIWDMFGDGEDIDTRYFNNSYLIYYDELDDQYYSTTITDDGERVTQEIYIEEKEVVEEEYDRDIMFLLILLLFLVVIFSMIGVLHK